MLCSLLLLLFTEGIVTMEIHHENITQAEYSIHQKHELEKRLCLHLNKVYPGEQFKKARQTTEENGRQNLGLFCGCVSMTVLCPSLHSVIDLKKICTNGELAGLYEEALMEDVIERLGFEDQRLRLLLNEWEYNLCLSEFQKGENCV